MKKQILLKNSLEAKLTGLPMVKEIRGLGMMIGIEVNQSVAPILASLRSAGLIVLSAGDNVIRLLPPLTVTTEELKKPWKSFLRY